MADPTTRPHKTRDDYLALPDEICAELIRGELYVTPSPRPRHQRVVTRLVREISRSLEQRGGGEAFVAPLDVHLPSGDIVQPDVIVVADAQAAIVRTDAVHGVPALLVEVLSSTHPERDRIVKLDLYAQNGVPEYWIVDPVARSVEVFRRAEDRYEPAGWFTGTSAVVSGTFPDLVVSAHRLFP